MAERRVQVRELDVPSMSSVTPTASPVETYTRPAPEPVQRSDLTEFLSAIAPAIQMQSEVELKDRLERERKIEAGIYKNQLNQAYQHAVQVSAGLSRDYDNNKDTYLNFRDDDEGTAADKLLAIRQKNINDNVSAMEREGVDKFIVQAFKNDMQMANTAFMKDVYLKDKAIQHEEQVYGKFGDSVIAVLDNKLGKDSQIVDINELYTAFVDANAGNHSKTLDYIWTIAEERSRSNADNALIDWLKSPLSSAKGQPAQWGVTKRIKQRGVIEARAIEQAKASKSAIKKQQINQSLAANAASAYATGEMSNLATDRDTLLGMGDNIRHKPEDYIPHIENEFNAELNDIRNTAVDDDTKQELALGANRKRFKFYSTYNLMPPQLSQSVNNGRTLLTMGDLTDPTNAEKAKKMYDELNMADAYSGGGIITTALKGEDVTRFRHLQALVKGGFDFQAALGMVQGKVFSGRSIKIDDSEMEKELDTWVPFYKTKASKARNIGVITNEVSKLAEAILQTDETASVDSAKRMAMELVTKDYQFIKNTDDSVTALRIESNALNSPVNVEQIEQGLIDIQNSLELRDFINTGLSVEDRLIGGLGRYVTKGANFDIYLKPGGNSNQVYIYAKPYGEEQEGTQNLFLGSLNIWDFNANRIKGLKEQLLEKQRTAIESGQLSAVTSTTPSLQPGGAAGEDAFTTTIANAISQVGNNFANDLSLDETMSNLIDQVVQPAQETVQEATSDKPKIDVPADGNVEIKKNSMFGNPFTILPAMGRTVVGDILRNQLGITQNDITRTEDYFSTTELGVIRGLVEKNLKGNKTKGSVSYKDYTTKSEDVAFATDVLPEKLIDPEFSVKTTLGQFNWEIDNRGHLIVTDKYDFNDAKSLQKANPSFNDKLSNLRTYASQPDIGTYGIIRRAAALFGSKEGEGVNFKIDLGPARNIPLPPRRNQG